MRVKISGTIQGVAAALREVEVEPGTINQMLARLARDYPALREVIEEGVSVAVDGVVYNSDFTRVVSAENDVVLLAPLVGG